MLAFRLVGTVLWPYDLVNYGTVVGVHVRTIHLRKARE